MVERFGRFVRRIYYGADVRLREHETRCLRCFVEAAEKEWQPLLTAQVDAIELIKREAGGKFIIFSLSGESPRVRDRRADLLVATVRLAPQGRADVYFTNGLLAAIEFGREPSGLLDSTVERCDPMVDLASSAPSPGSKKTEDELRGILGDGEIVDVLSPAPPAFQEAFVSRLNGSLPSGFRRLLAISDGFRWRDVRFEGTQSRTLPWPDRTLAVLAETVDGVWALCLEDRSGNETLQILNQTEATLEEVEGDFVQALHTLQGIAKQEAQDQDPD